MRAAVRVMEWFWICWIRPRSVVLVFGVVVVEVCPLAGCC